MNTISLADLERHLWEAAHIITGPIDASDYKQYIFPLLFYKRLSDVYQDEYEQALKFSHGDREYARLPEQHRFVIPDSAQWEKLRETFTHIGVFLQTALRGIEKCNPHLYGVFGDGQWTNKDRLPDHLLSSLVEHFSKIPLGIEAVNQDDLGEAYEYLIKKWDRKNFSTDPFGRNEFGVPPQGCADYAFFQHIIKSLDPNTGRAAMLWPHGVLFRDSEASIREQVIKADCIEAVIGLGPNLFYNSPMESCMVVLRMNKPGDRKNKILFINRVKEVTRERAFSFLSRDNLEKISGAYFSPESHGDIARMADVEEIRENLYNLSIPLYVSNGSKEDGQDLTAAIEAWQMGRVALKKQTKKLFEALAELGFNP